MHQVAGLISNNLYGEYKYVVKHGSGLRKSWHQETTITGSTQYKQQTYKLCLSLNLHKPHNIMQLTGPFLIN
jgi:hypothetical protein